MKRSPQTTTKPRPAPAPAPRPVLTDPQKFDMFWAAARAFCTAEAVAKRLALAN
jgi:hypothetical protein